MYPPCPHIPRVHVSPMFMYPPCPRIPYAHVSTYPPCPHIPRSFHIPRSVPCQDNYHIPDHYHTGIIAIPGSYCTRIIPYQDYTISGLYQDFTIPGSYCTRIIATLGSLPYPRSFPYPGQYCTQIITLSPDHPISPDPHPQIPRSVPSPDYHIYFLFLLFSFFTLTQPFYLYPT